MEGTAELAGCSSSSTPLAIPEMSSLNGCVFKEHKSDQLVATGTSLGRHYAPTKLPSHFKQKGYRDFSRKEGSLRKEVSMETLS